MLRFYTPVLILQVYCLYHAYKHRVEHFWFFLIIFFPLIGSLFYLFKHAFNKKSVDQVADGVQELVNSNYKVEQLEKEAGFADTFVNKVKLADEYAAKGNYEEAKALYQSCLTGHHVDDPGLRRKLLMIHYLSEDYAAAVACGDHIQNEKTFKHTEERVAYAWALYHLNRPEQAETIFEDMDVRFSNYYHRLEYASFLNTTDRRDAAKEKIRELLDEIDHMDRYEQRLKKKIHQDIKSFYRQIV